MDRFASAVLAASLMTATVAPATAADLAPMPDATWTGLYGGLNIGAGFGSNSTSYSPNDASSDLLFVIGGRPPNQDLNMSGVIGGVQLGYNWQVSEIMVLGLEADFQMSGVEDSRGGSASIAGPERPVKTNVSEDVDALGTLRGRIGFLASSNLLIYGTGGLALGKISTDARYTLTGGDSAAIDNPPKTVICYEGITCFKGGNDSWNVGWTAGAGFEFAFAPRWTLGAEYLYADLNTDSFNETGQQQYSDHGCCSSFKVKLDDTVVQTVRVKVNYRF